MEILPKLAVLGMEVQQLVADYRLWLLLLITAGLVLLAFPLRHQRGKRAKKRRAARKYCLSAARCRHTDRVAESYKVLEALSVLQGEPKALW